jgi:hypothetical protein
MSPADLDQIEHGTGLKLPDSYRAVMRCYPFGAKDFGCDMLCDDIKTLIRTNRRPHEIPPSGPTRDYLWIGSDGGESYYYLELRSTSSQIYEYDLEKGELTLFAEDLDAFILKVRQLEQAIEEEEQLAKSRKWWRLWR